MANSLLPLARLYIRFGPAGPLKTTMWNWAKWRERTYQAETCFGSLIRGSTHDLVQGYIYYFGVWEPNLTDFLQRRLRNQSNRTFVDVGANVGYYSLLAASAMKSDSRIVAIEAFPSIHEKLLINLGLNQIRNVRPLQVAASDQVSEIEIYYAGSLNEGKSTTLPGRFKVTPVKVEARPLADLLTVEEVRSLKVMKVDVEGAEAAVLRGFESVMKYLPVDAEIVVEVTPDSTTETQNIFEFFRCHGFNAYFLENSYDAVTYLSKGTVTRPKRIHEIPTAQTDVVFSRLDQEVL